MIAQVIALLQQKGGSGKTTTAMNLAGGLREKGHTVLLIDMDQDKPDAWSWANKYDPDQQWVLKADDKKIRQVLDTIKTQAAYIIIDTPPNFQTAALKAALLADMVLIPAAPSGMDLSGLLEAKDLAITADRPFFFVANRVVKNVNMSTHLMEALEQEGPTCHVSIPQSIKFVEAENIGQYIGQYAPMSTPHLAVRNVVDSLISFLKGVQ